MRQEIIPIPTLSICIPTYNRANNLKNLLEQLKKIKKELGNKLEVCISNNHSTDNTKKLIEGYSGFLEAKVLHQEANIGGTMNMIAVSTIASGKFRILVGDDDGINAAGLNNLIKLLAGLGDNDWVLSGVANHHGQEHLLMDFQEGGYSKKDFRRKILRTSLYPFGFMAVHVFPAFAAKKMATLNIKNAQPWPHIALFLRSLFRGRVLVFKEPIVIQAQGEGKLFWAAGDLASITLSRLKIIRSTMNEMGINSFFFLCLMFRDLYFIPNIKLMIAWRLYEPDDFNRRAWATYYEGYKLFHLFILGALPHALLVIFLKICPLSISDLILKCARKEYLVERYIKRKQNLGLFDGIKRGI